MGDLEAIEQGALEQGSQSRESRLLLALMQETVYTHVHGISSTTALPRKGTSSSLWLAPIFRLASDVKVRIN